MIRFTLILFVLLCYQSNGQTVSFGEAQYYELPSNFEVKDALLTTNHILLVGFIRDKNSGDIDSYAILINKEGETEQEFHLKEPTSFSQIVKVTQVEDEYFLLENSAGPNGSSVNLLQLDVGLNLTHDYKIINKQSCIGADLIAFNNELMYVGVWDGSDYNKSFPIVYSHNLDTGERNSVSLDQKNSIEKMKFRSPDKSWSDEQKQAFEELEKYEQTKMVKHLNKLVVHKNDLYVLGAENSANITDYWYGKLNKGLNIAWEYIREEEEGIGGDWLLNAFSKNDKLHVVGYHYNKKDLGYNFNYLVINESGEIDINKVYDFGQHEVVEGMIALDDFYLQYGYSTDKIWGFSDYEEQKREALFLLLNNDGDILDNRSYLLNGFKSIVKAESLEGESFMVLGTQTIHGEKKYFTIKGDLILKP